MSTYGCLDPAEHTLALHLLVTHPTIVV